MNDDLDYRFSLANERTFLAWNRTALALVAAGAGVAELLPGDDGGWARTALGIWLIAIGVIVTLFAPRRLRAAEAAMRQGAALPTTRLVDVLAVGTVAGAIAVVPLILFT